jgi:predicted transcriptional regulator
MDILFRRGSASAADVRDDLPDPPSYSAVRGMLRLLEDKGHCTHRWDGPRHVYRPTADPASVGESAARHLFQTFFSGSMESAIAAMLGATERPLSDDEAARLTRLIADARKKGKRR